MKRSAVHQILLGDWFETCIDEMSSNPVTVGSPITDSVSAATLIRLYGCRMITSSLNSNSLQGWVSSTFWITYDLITTGFPFIVGWLMWSNNGCLSAFNPKTKTELIELIVWDFSV